MYFLLGSCFLFSIVLLCESYNLSILSKQKREMMQIHLVSPRLPVESSLGLEGRVHIQLEDMEGSLVDLWEINRHTRGIQRTQRTQVGPFFDHGE